MSELIRFTFNGFSLIRPIKKEFDAATFYDSNPKQHLTSQVNSDDYYVLE